MSKSSALLPIDNPRKVTGGYQTGPIPVTTGTFGHHTSIRLVRLAYQEARAALGLPEGVHSYAILPIGYPMGKFGPVGRGKLSDFVYLDKWEQPYPAVKEG